MLDILIICGSNTKLEFICGNMLLNSNWREGHYSHYLFIWNWSNLFYKHFELGTNHANTTISSRTVWHLASLPIHLTSIKCEIITLSAHSYPTYKMTCWWNTNKWNLKLFIELWINVGRQHAKDVFFLERRKERGIKYFVRKLMHWLDKFEQIVTFPLIHFDFWTKQNFILASFANQLKLLHFEMTSYIFVDYILDYYCKVGT